MTLPLRALHQCCGWDLGFMCSRLPFVSRTALCWEQGQVGPRLPRCALGLRRGQLAACRLASRSSTLEWTQWEGSKWGSRRGGKAACRAWGVSGTVALRGWRARGRKVRPRREQTQIPDVRAHPALCAGPSAQPARCAPGWEGRRPASPFVYSAVGEVMFLLFVLVCVLFGLFTF